MRAALCLVLAACFARQPEPQGPRMVCNGVAYPIGYAVAASSTCHTLPADRCWNDGSPECRREALDREEANQAAKKRETTALVVLGVLALSLVVVAAAN